MASFFIFCFKVYVQFAREGLSSSLLGQSSVTLQAFSSKLTPLQLLSSTMQTRWRDCTEEPNPQVIEHGDHLDHLLQPVSKIQDEIIFYFFGNQIGKTNALRVMMSTTSHAPRPRMRRAEIRSRATDMQ